MTRAEIGAAYAGQRIYALVTRMGGKGRDIHTLAVYEIRANGSMHHVAETMHCVANKGSYRALAQITHGNYYCGRPTAELIADRVAQLVQ